MSNPHNTRRRSVGFAVPFQYPVVFTRNAFEVTNPALVQLFRRPDVRRQRVFAIVDSGLACAQPDLMEQLTAYVEANADVLELVAPVAVLPGGEQCKNDPEVLASLQSRLAEHHMDRHSYVMAVGGGAVLDVVGYAAATVHRGVRLLRLPSTVLAQNDAGVGVKNGINAFGQKNFLGTFAPPYAVVNDATLLRSLPLRDVRAGLAEAVKVALIRDLQFFDWLCDHAPALARQDEEALEYSIQRSAELHLDHIQTGGDPFEQGSARPLDFGHWVAHKLEGLTAHRLRHGEAVAIGIALDSLYSAFSGWLDHEDARKIVRLLQVLGLPTSDAALHARGSDGQWLALRGLDEFREHLGGQLSVTFLHGIGRAETHHDVDARRMQRCAEVLGRLSDGRAGSAEEQWDDVLSSSRAPLAEHA